MLDVCQGWSHLRCIGMKEDVRVMEGKEFVCHFCLSACLLMLRKVVSVFINALKRLIVYYTPPPACLGLDFDGDFPQEKRGAIL